MALIWNIPTLCVQHGLTDEAGQPSAQALAYKCGLWPTTAKGLLSGKQQAVSLDILSRLAAVFGGHDKLFFDDGQPVQLAPKPKRRIRIDLNGNPQ